MALAQQRFSIDYSREKIENKRNFSLHTGDLVEKWHTETGTRLESMYGQ